MLISGLVLSAVDIRMNLEANQASTAERGIQAIFIALLFRHIVITMFTKQYVNKTMKI